MRTRPNDLSDLDVLDTIARLLRESPGGMTVHKRARNDEFVAVELPDGRLYNLTIQEVDLEKI